MEKSSETETQLIFMPGSGCQVFEDYPKTCAALTEANFAITAIEPSWNSTFGYLVEKVKQEVHRSIGRNVLVLAHSRGANAVMPALVHQPHVGAIMASPSMTCAEGYANSETRALAEERYPGQGHALRRVSMMALARASTILPEQAAVLVGEQELATYPFMGDIADRTATGFGVDVTYVAESPHFIDHHDNYIQAVVDAATRIRAIMA